MTESEVFEVLRGEIRAVLPGLDAAHIVIDSSLKDLGADSMDRAEIVQQTMRRLGLRVSATELVAVNNMAGLVKLLAQRKSQAAAP